VPAHPRSAIIGAANGETCQTLTRFVAEYEMVPYTDYNLLKFPDKKQALSNIRDLTMHTDILPKGFHGAVTAGVEVGFTVYVAGAGPVGLAAAVSAQILGAAVVMIGT